MIRHIAILMDGNRRWAQERGFPVGAGHHVGASHILPLVRWCSDVGIAYLTLHSFSTENWRRAAVEGVEPTFVSPSATK
jgi:undecaprenyl diphosphate synthase